MPDPVIPSILVIDDDKNQRNMLTFALENKGYRVVAVSGGQEALDIAKTYAFDAAVCDVMMPFFDGLDTLKGLKDTQPTLAVIMATGYGTAEAALRSKKLGAVNYLAKPYELNELLELLDKAIKTRRGP